MLLFLCGVFPFSARAEIFINEVAWMGTDEGGANCEWVELKNTEDMVVDLSSWTLTIENAGTGAPKVIALGESASVKYSGIAGNGYYLIARDSGSCKDLVPHTSADWLGSFGNGISNSGAKLILKEGSEERDSVDSKTGWETTKNGIGGKNTAPKETPQLSGNAWITASPTPRSPNRSAPLEELPDEEEEGNIAPVVTVGGTAPLVPVVHPIPKLFVDGGPSRIVVAGADTTFSAIAYDSTGVVRKNANISWAFGDSGQEKGEEVLYAYKKPGTYTAVVRAKDKGVSAVSLIEVVVVDAGVTIHSVTEDGITLRNMSGRLADLSGWKVSVGEKTVKLPSDTVVAGNGTAFLPFENLRTASSSDLVLKFPNGRLAHAYTQPSVPEAELYQGQEQVPAKPLAVAPRSAYAKAVSAPAVEALPSTAGAASSSRTVILKEDQNAGSFMAGVLSSLLGVFSR